VIPAPLSIADVLDLAVRCEAGERSNSLDVEIEIALFEPDAHYVAARANAAGTKVIYTRCDHSAVTHLARDWTSRKGTAAVLRARASMMEQGK